MGGAYLLHARAAPDSATAAPSEQAAHSTPVLAATVETRDMPVTVDAIGTVQPLATVAVRSRVDGQIVKVGFVEGDWVEAGALLFQLDDRTARSQIAQAQANLARDKAQLADAERIVARNEALADRGFAAKAALDTARANAAALVAAAAANAAQIETLRTQLDYTTIRAPIAGRTGAQAFKLGANVKANDTIPLVTINQTRPISVAFSVPQTELAAIRAAQTTRSLPVTATVKGSKVVTAQGTLSFIDNTVDPATGTIALKATLPNADEALWPGQFVDVSVLVETRPGVAVVPSTAVLVGQQGAYVFAIRPNLTVEARTVLVDRTIDGLAYVTQGLAPGERVVTDGQLRLAPDLEVDIQPSQPAPGPAPPPSQGASS